MVNGVPHGPDRGGTVCQLHMRRFRDGETITIEPWRARAFPVVKDLVVDRSAFDRIIAAGGYVSVNSGGGARGQQLFPIAQDVAEQAMDSAAVHRLRRLRRGLQERLGRPVHQREDHAPRRCCPRARSTRRAASSRWSIRWTREGFGMCSNEGECEAVCPKEISISNIARMNREYFKASLGRP